MSNIESNNYYVYKNGFYQKTLGLMTKLITWLLLTMFGSSQGRASSSTVLFLFYL